MKHGKEIIAVFLGALVVYGCSQQSRLTSSPVPATSGNGSSGITTTTLIPPASTVPPPSTTVPSPPGGNVCCPSLGGCFSSDQQVINYANSTGNSGTCITVNSIEIRNGFAPCIACTDPSAPTTTTTTRPPPTTTTTIPTPTTSPGWPTTTQPGASGDMAN